MIVQAQRFGRLVFDRDAIVRAALRAYFEGIFGNFPLQRLSFAACAELSWAGNLHRGGFYNGNGCGDYDVVVWTEAGVVGLACELGWGPIEQLDLSPDAVTGGPDDVRAAVPGLPSELLPAFEMAVGMLDVGLEHGERQAGVGFWLHGDHVGGTMFNDRRTRGAPRLAAWGLLHHGRLLPVSSQPGYWTTVLECARTKDASIHALIDAVVDRRMLGPTELTAEEIETLFPTKPDPETLLYAQRMLQKVGITWPGSPELPPEAPPPTS